MDCMGVDCCKWIDTAPGTVEDLQWIDDPSVYFDEARGKLVVYCSFKEGVHFLWENAEPKNWKTYVNLLCHQGDYVWLQG